MVSSALLLSPVERLSRTQGLWLLNNVSREEATRLLGDKEKGNFIVRESQKPGTKALSIRTNGQVQHFILIRRVNSVFLEDSDLQFDSLVSLIFHYSTVRSCPAYSHSPPSSPRQSPHRASTPSPSLANAFGTTPCPSLVGAPSCWLILSVNYQPVILAVTVTYHAILSWLSLVVK